VPRQLTDFVINNRFAHLVRSSVESYYALFDEVCQRTAQLMSDWMRGGLSTGDEHGYVHSGLDDRLRAFTAGRLDPYQGRLHPNTDWVVIKSSATAARGSSSGIPGPPKVRAFVATK